MFGRRRISFRRVLRFVERSLDGVELGAQRLARPLGIAGLCGGLLCRQPHGDQLGMVPLVSLELGHERIANVKEPLLHLGELAHELARRLQARADFLETRADGVRRGEFIFAELFRRLSRQLWGSTLLTVCAGRARTPIGTR